MATAHDAVKAALVGLSTKVYAVLESRDHAYLATDVQRIQQLASGGTVLLAAELLELSPMPSDASPEQRFFSMHNLVLPVGGEGSLSGSATAHAVLIRRREMLYFALFRRNFIPLF